jgi:hypothetical protein
MLAERCSTPYREIRAHTAADAARRFHLISRLTQQTIYTIIIYRTCSPAPLRRWAAAAYLLFLAALQTHLLVLRWVRRIVA